MPLVGEYFKEYYFFSDFHTTVSREKKKKIVGLYVENNIVS